jgi:uncharacterized protein (TIGR02147 family)
MGKAPLHPGLLLRGFFQAKQKHSYSMTAFARHLQVSKGHLSKIFAGEQMPSPSLVEKIRSRLELGEEQRNELALSVCYHSLPGEESRSFFLSSRLPPGQSHVFREVLENREQLLRDWYNIAILDLMTCADARPDLSWIAARLGLSAPQAASAVSLLFRLGYLVEAGGRWRKSERCLEFSTKKSEQAVRDFHRQMIERAVGALAAGESGFEGRLITGLTVATRPERIELAKQHLRKTLKEMMALLDCEDPTTLYQLNTQLFSLCKEDR